MTSPSSLRMALIGGVALGAFGLTQTLGSSGAHHGVGAAGSAAMIVAFVTILFHLQGHAVMSFLEAAADGFEKRLEAGGMGDQPAMNEDLQRAGRKAALRGVKVAINRYYRAVRLSPFDHDMAVARRFRREALAWVRRQIRDTVRKDRPENGGWLQPGLGLDAVLREPKLAERGEAAVMIWETLAWEELSKALAARDLVPPNGFRGFFTGDQNCGMGWRRAGHLLLMKELKTNHAAFVGFVVETQTQTLDAVRSFAAPPIQGPGTQIAANEGVADKGVSPVRRDQRRAGGWRWPDWARRLIGRS